MEPNEIDGLDRARIEGLMCEILEPIQRNYKRGPVSRDRALEALNALAAAAGLVIRGADGDPEAMDFFMKALVQHSRKE